MPPATTFDLTFRPSPDAITEVRKFVERMHQLVAHDLDLGSQIAVGVHELLENATLHSVDGEVVLRVELDDARRVTIRTRNRVRPDDVERVRTVISEITVGDPMQYYLAAMKRPRRGTNGGLGLGRIAVESEMDLEMRYEGEFLEIAASTRAA